MESHFHSIPSFNISNRIAHILGIPLSPMGLRRTGRCQSYVLRGTRYVVDDRIIKTRNSHRGTRIPK